MIPTDEIIKMAKECGLVLYFDVNVDRQEEIKPITAFAALVSARAAAIEREACAKVCESLGDALDRQKWPTPYEIAAMLRTGEAE